MKEEVSWLMEYLDERPVLPEIEGTIGAACAWSQMDHGYDSKNKRIREWNRNAEHGEFYRIVTNIFISTLLHPQGMTYQAMIGYVAGNVRCADPLDQAKCAAEIIALAYQNDLVVITKVSDQTMLITTEFVLPVDIPEFDKHQPEFQQPRQITSAPILGNRFKQHALDVCSDHINRMNAIPLTLESRIIYNVPETTTADLETDEQIMQWEDFRDSSFRAYHKALDYDHFYLKHGNDTRGRCYCSGYYINYQGTSYKKAIVQLANKEVVKLTSTI